MDRVRFFIAHDLEDLQRVQSEINAMCKEDNCKIKLISVVDGDRQMIVTIVFEEPQEFAFLPNGTKVMLERGKK